MIAERAGRAMRKPPVEAMLSSAGSQIGQGWAFGLDQALDQAGATFGPLVMALVLLLHGSYRTGYALLLVSVGFAFATVLVARHYFPRPHELEANPGVAAGGLPRSFWWYVVAGGCVAAGFADFALVGYHLQQAKVVSKDLIPVYYAVAMGVGALGALLLGRLFDRSGIRTVLVAFGLYDTGYGAFWFAGSWLMGFLYSRSVRGLVIFSLSVRLVSLPVFWLTYRGASRRD